MANGGSGSKMFTQDLEPRLDRLDQEVTDIKKDMATIAADLRNLALSVRDLVNNLRESSRSKWAPVSVGVTIVLAFLGFAGFVVSYMQEQVRNSVYENRSLLLSHQDGHPKTFDKQLEEMEKWTRRIEEERRFWLVRELDRLHEEAEDEE